ncbi:ABC transporter permease/substrate-binding protein [Bacillus sp. AFS053548]|uniref:ABC transporter permease/substrate-binding protein n=1 Tax=Bacillus sp. AFS053548 TaxID=2033505 RepID=UPI000BFCBCA3|nr:ABC transporter permease/substrate-binding protein [Bacillus sp. AFS053548]PGM59527.1 glycine/betaine ABC transporter permease [Bacillus sp. AFS053548]
MILTSFTTTLENRKEQLLTALLEHIQISVFALIIAIIIAVPLGIYLTRKKVLSEFVIGTTAVIQTIPSLALLGILIPLVGIGKIPAVIALSVYALLPILRNTYTGIKEIDPILLEAATGLGMNGRQRLFKVELPLALPVMMAGIRTAMVIIVGTATIAALIGAGGLGSLILLGIDRNDMNFIIIGAIPSALLAIIFDFILRLIEKRSFKSFSLRIITASFILLALLFSPLTIKSWNKTDLVIAGKLGAEPEIIMNMYKLMIEDETNLNVEVKPNFGKTTFVYNALKKGDIDIYPEYTGTVISTFLKEKAVSNDANAVYEQAAEGLAKKYNLSYLEPMKFNDTYALAVPEHISKQYGIETISDATKVENQLKAGFTLEFTDREDGYLGLQKLYGLKFQNLKTMEPKLRYDAIQSGDLSIIDAYSTDSELQSYNMKVLVDDKNLFPPYQCAPLLRKETLKKYPEVKNILNKLKNKITDDEMREMNYKVNVGGKSAESVAREFLKNEGLLK